MSDGALQALIGGGFGVVVAMIGYLAHTNKKDHKDNGSKLDYIGDLLKEHFRNHP
jgi:uncharacterized membrane protein YsdA (DUF1294 family)